MEILTNAKLFFVAGLLLVAASVSSCSQHGQTGAAVGGALGAVTGALIDDDNRWRGAAIGGAIGATLGGTLGEISNQASKEAVREGKPVVYESNDGYRRVESSPVGYNEETRCHKVRERAWDNGKLVKDEVKEICESDKTEPVY